MRAVLNIISAMPTAIFSGALLFVLAWWLAGFAIGGLHGSHAGHGHHAGDGHVGHSDHHLGHHGSHGSHHGHDAHGHDAHGHDGAHGAHSQSRVSELRAGISDMPLSMSCLILTFGAWATSVVGTAVIRAAGYTSWSRSLRIISVLGIALIACFLGLVALAGFGAVAAPLFEDQSHPGKGTAVGSRCRVRIAPSVGRLGDAYVIDGPSARSIVRIEADPTSSPLHKNDVVLIIDFDDSRDAFIVSEIEPGLLADTGTQMT